MNCMKWVSVEMVFRCGKGPDVNILIVKLSAIGDVIHTLPALNAIRAHYPGAHITWLVEAAAADLVVGHRALDRVLISKRKSWLGSFGERADGRRSERFGNSFTTFEIPAMI
jgi:ADP-heptose:LPS heptosyltransferase